MVVAAAVLVALLAQPARADSRPTSGDISLLTGRTPGVGETAIAGGVGWPSVWAMAAFAPRSTFNLALRVDVLFGNPLAGIDTAIGGQLSFPLRFHVYGGGSLDLAVHVRPFGVVGEGASVGERGAYAGDIGWAAGTEVGLLGGYQASDRVTLGFGVGGELTYVDTPAAPGGNAVIGTLLVRGALEALMSRDTLLFLDVAAGYAFAEERRFDGKGIIRLSIGLGYLL